MEIQEKRMCPKCKETSEYECDNPYIEREEIIVKCKCLKCGCKFTEIFVYHNIKKE